MTHEFKNIVEQALKAQSKKLKSVLVTVVDLDGSSYRKPGVRMLIVENSQMIGAISGGCVEKEVVLQSQSVFKTGISKIITYNGRYRLGCEGVLYILIELFKPSKSFYEAFKYVLKKRKSFQVESYFKKEVVENSNFGSYVLLDDVLFPISTLLPKVNNELTVFKQYMPPCFKLIIIGTEYDAVDLCKYAVLTGWEVIIVAGLSTLKSIEYFPNASQFVSVEPENLDISSIDKQTAIVLMNHNFASDLRYLVALKDTNPNYIGLLGAIKRRDDLLSQFIEYCPEVSNEFIDSIHGPAGLNIGSETSQEIAISIISEILAITRNKKPMPLSEKIRHIHTS